jgi:hypothetical protein
VHNENEISDYSSTILSFIFLSPPLSNLEFWGKKDWDQHSFYVAVPRTTMLEYTSFCCGIHISVVGMPCLQTPNLPFNFFFLLLLMFGVTTVLKLEIAAYFTLGLI